MSGTDSYSGRRDPIDIEIEDVSKRFGAFQALNQVSLKVGAGELLTLLGPSGSGKTTLLNILAGFQVPDQGHIRFGREDVTNMDMHLRGLGMVFQNYALFPHLDVFENIAFPLRVRRVSAGERAQRVNDALRLVRLPDMGRRSIATLSGGQRQRVALARAVVFSPQIVLMDEPLSALDKNLREQMQIEIRQMHRSFGATTINVTHDQREALTISDRIAVMNHGGIVQCGTPGEIYNRPASAFVATFIGESTLLPVAFANSIVTPGGNSYEGLTLGGDQHRLVIRPERVLVEDELDATSFRLRVRVEDVVYQGDSVLVVTHAPGDIQLNIRRPQAGPGALRTVPMEGELISVGVSASHTVVVPAE